jgi:hypothetical protein
MFLTLAAGGDPLLDAEYEGPHIILPIQGQR